MNDQPAPSTSASLGNAAVLGAAVGLRSVLPLALLAAAANRRVTIPPFLAATGRPWELFGSRGALVGLGIAAAGEIVVDKLPFTPSRLRPGPLAGRLAFGALAGAAVCRQGRVSPPAGAVIGAAAGYHARQALDRATGAPDMVWAIVEDLLALGVGVFALRRYLLP